jgi:hypothetical protein
MLVTPHFILLNMPMTGATLVADMLRAMYGECAIESGRKHAGCEEIPETERGKPLLSVFRSPFERYVSQYHYGCWRKQPGMYCDPAPIRLEYPEYPNVTFKQFVRIANAYFLAAEDRSDPDALQIGWHTEQYLRFYGRDPAAACERIRARGVCADSLDGLEHQVHFLHADADGLKRPLLSFLQQFDIAENSLARLDAVEPSSPQHTHELRLHRDVRKYYDSALTAFVLQREQWLFERFSHSVTVAA